MAEQKKVTKISLFDSYKAVWKKYAVFDGRLSQKGYWNFFLVQFLITLLLGILTAVTVVPEFFGMLQVLYMFAALLPSLAAMVRRLHDSDRSGALVLLALVPFVGPIVLIVLLAEKGTKGKNDYGPVPEE